MPLVATDTANREIDFLPLPPYGGSVMPAVLNGEPEFVSASDDPRKPALIAVVDDDEDVRAALDGLLGSLGYDAVLFDSADALLGSPLLGQVDCIISDVQMPGSSGLDLAEAIQPRATPIILITAYPTIEVAQRAAAAGVLRVLTKPFESHELIEELSRLLGT